MPAMVQTRPAPVWAATVMSSGSCPFPGVVDEVGAVGYSDSGDFGAPGLDADHRLGPTAAHFRDDFGDSVDVLGGGDRFAASGFGATDLDDRGPDVEGAFDSRNSGRRGVGLGRGGRRRPGSG